MATDTKTTESAVERRRRRAAAGTPVADEGDVAFGAMAGIAVLAAIVVSLFAAGGIFPVTGGSGGTAAPVETEEAEEEDVQPVVDDSVDLAAARDQLSAAGFGGIQLTLDGATIIASGEVADEAARDEILALLSARPNVEAVIDQLTITPSAPTPADAFVRANDATVTLTGTVPTEEMASELRAAAAAAYPANRITDELEVVEGAEPFRITASGTLTDPDTSRLLNDALSGISPLFDNQLRLDADAGAELNALFELQPVLFQANTNVILEPSLPTLDRAAEILDAFPNVAIEIGGHTDLRGPEDENQILSKSRAEAVEAALRERGVTNQLTAVGYGETQPLFDPDDTLEKQQANRRIEFKEL